MKIFNRVSFYLNNMPDHRFEGVIVDIRLHGAWAVVKVDTCDNEYDREKLGSTYMVRVDRLQVMA